MFQIKLSTVVRASPAEVANALATSTLRPLWEPRLSEVKQERKQCLMTRYVGYTMGYERSFNFAVLPSEAKERDFAIIENIIVNKG